MDQGRSETTVLPLLFKVKRPKIHKERNPLILSDSIQIVNVGTRKYPEKIWFSFGSGSSSDSLGSSDNLDKISKEKWKKLTRNFRRERKFERESLREKVDLIENSGVGRRVSVRAAAGAPRPLFFLLLIKFFGFTYVSFIYRLVKALVRASSAVVISVSEPASGVALQLE
ncbi:hypothetical protein YC2023_100026 [Brassica napus]